MKQTMIYYIYLCVALTVRLQGDTKIYRYIMVFEGNPFAAYFLMLLYYK